MSEATKPLNRDGIGLLGATTLGVVMLSPAMTLYGGFGPAYLNAGMAAPLAFIWAFFATLPTACSYVLLSREYPTSGSAADWAEKAFSKKVGIWAGWMVFLYYLTNFIIQPVTLGVFAGDLLKLVHFTPGFFSFAAGAVICLLWSASFVYRGLSISSRGALAFLLLESFVVCALCFTVLWVAKGSGQTFSAEGFHLSASPTGSTGVFRAMVFAILAFCGFDVVSTLAEETKMPEKVIPRATILSLLVYAGIIIAGIWALSYGASREQMQKIAEGGQMPISELARMVWGRGGILIPITGISATLGLAIATAIGSSRVLFSMARGGLAPIRFSALSESKTPKQALHVIFGIALVSTLLTSIFLSPYDSYVWWGTSSTFFAMITYLLVNGANLVLNRKRWRDGLFGFFAFLLIPAFGFVVDAYLLYRTFFYELWHQDWATGKSVLVVDVFCALVALAVALRSKKTGVV